MAAAGPGAVVAAALESMRPGLWAPVLLGGGIALYAGLPFEPAPWTIAVIAVVAGLAAGLGLAGLGRLPALGLALLCAGFLLMKARTGELAAPTIARASGPHRVTGFVRDTEVMPGKRRKVTLDVSAVSDIPVERRPARLRIIMPQAVGLVPGAAVRVSAWLRPLPGPVMPGAHDFAQAMWFERIGGSGFATGPPEIRTDIEAPLGLRLWGRVAALREAMGGRIRAVLGEGERAAFAEALMTGERGGIGARLTEDMQISGLAHILSISGLHMALVAGGMFWLVRALLALVPMLALSWPVKKIAAAMALITAAAYLILSGNDVATLRSALMLGLAFTAVLLDRSAINMRGVAVAATLILLAMPEAILSASMQLSFMAVMAIIALYEVARETGLIEEALGKASPLRARLVLWSLGLAGASLVAGAATAPIAAYHFNRLSPWSLVANLLAEPLMSLLVMPMALVSALAMPVGLDVWPLKLMGLGLDGVMWIAACVAGWPGARAMVPSLALPGVIVLAGGLFALMLGTGRMRIVGVPLIAAGLLWAATKERPDLLIERTAQQVALRNADGKLALMDARRARFAAKRWLAAEGEDITAAVAAKRSGWSCDEAGVCTGTLGRFRVIYLPRTDETAADLPCAAGDIVIAEFPLRRRCGDARLTIDRFSVWKHGAHAVTLNGQGEPDVTTAAQGLGMRPWVTRPQPRQTVMVSNGG